MERKPKSIHFSFFTKHAICQTITLALLFFIVPAIHAQEQPDSSLSKLISMDLEDLMNLKVSIATKSSQTESESPSIISVITAEEIQKMGARELEDVLQTIPGFELNRSYGGYFVMGVRGIKDSRTTSKILLMINGVPSNRVFFGDMLQWGYDLNLDNIERIEVIRGPGSALYGRNAFTAVINIITKQQTKSKSISAKARIGSFNTISFSGLYSYMKNKFDVSIAVQTVKTDVTDVKFDQGFGDIGPINLKRDNLLINTGIGFGKFRFLGNYSDVFGNAPLNETYITNKRGSYSLSFDDSIKGRLSIHARIFGHNSFYMEDIEQLKSNFQVIIPVEMGGNESLTFADIYPDGIIYKPQSNEYLYGMESDIRLRLHEKNDLLIGIQADFHGVEDVIIKSNYNFATGLPFPGMNRVNMEKYEPGWFENDGHSYYNVAFILQDITYLKRNVGITLGGRFDIDSEIGSSINPRAGLVIEPSKKTSLKFLYGRAYRAPAPSEQFQTLGFAIGNKELKPEIINTIEIAFSFRYNKTRNTINIYRNKLTDMIFAEKISFVDPNNKYYNIGKNTSTGIEFESKFILGQSIYSYLNYSYCFSENTRTIDGIDSVYNHPDVAPHKLNFGINYSFIEHFNLNVNMYYRSEMEKFIVSQTAMKVQDPIGGFAIFNSTFTIQNLIKNITFSLSAYNFTDTKYYSQDNQHFNQGAQPGRQFIFGMSYVLK
jgi:iron complex outermembrane receptor protein